MQARTRAGRAVPLVLLESEHRDKVASADHVAATEAQMPSTPEQDSYINPYEVHDPQVEETGVVEIHDGVAGDAAALDEDGYQAVKQENNKVEMEHFVRRVIESRNETVCDHGSLMGLVQFYYKMESGNSYGRLLEELDIASNGSCPWVGSRANHHCTTNRSIGANASMDEDGHKQVQRANCFPAMARFITRVANQNGYHICNEAGLQGLTHYYFRPNSDGNYTYLIQELGTAVAKDCPWVVRKEMDCPPMADGKCTGPAMPAAVPRVFQEEQVFGADVYNENETELFTEKVNTEANTSIDTSKERSASAGTTTSNVSASNIGNSSGKAASDASGNVTGNSSGSTSSNASENGTSDASGNSSTDTKSSTSDKAGGASDANASDGSAAHGTSNASTNTSGNASEEAGSKSTEGADQMDKKAFQAAFKAARKKNSVKEMSEFFRQFISKKGYYLCLEGGLQGVVNFYWKKDSTKNFEDMQKEVDKATEAEKCPWVLKHKEDRECPKAEDPECQAH